MPSFTIPAAAAATTISGGLGASALAAGTASGISLATAASIGSTALGALGALQSGAASSSAAGYNAQVAANNAKLAQQNAEMAGAQGEQNVAVESAKTRAKIAATLADQGASGVDVNSGSAVDVRASEAKLGMLNSLNIRADAARKAYGYETEAATQKGQENLYKSEKKSAKIGGWLDAGGTVLGGIAKASQYSNFLGKSDPTSGLTNVSSSDGFYDFNNEVKY